MARFIIRHTRNSGLYSCEFEIQPIDDALALGEIFSTTDRGRPVEYVILAVLRHPARDGDTTLVCLNYAYPGAGLTGERCESRPMNDDEKKKYAKCFQVG
jgi:hypothetical protein